MTLASDINITLICNVEIYWHKFSIDHDKTWKKVPTRAGQFLGLHGPNN